MTTLQELAVQNAQLIGHDLLSVNAIRPVFFLAVVFGVPGDSARELSILASQRAQSSDLSQSPQGRQVNHSSSFVVKLPVGLLFRCMAAEEAQPGRLRLTETRELPLLRSPQVSDLLAGGLPALHRRNP